MGRPLRKIADDALALPEQDRLTFATELDRRVEEADRTGGREQ